MWAADEYGTVIAGAQIPTACRAREGKVLSAQLREELTGG